MNQWELLGQEYDSLGHLTSGIPASEILFRFAFWKSDQDGAGQGTTRVVKSGTVTICWKEHKLGFISVDFIIIPLQGLSFTFKQINLVLQCWCVSYKVITKKINK